MNGAPPVDPTKTATESVPPIPVNVISTTGTGDGSLKGAVGVTPGSIPNLAVSNVISPLTALVVRFLNVFFLTLSGVVTANTFLHFADVKTVVIAAACAAGVGLIKDCATIFGKLEGKYPLLTGSI